MSLGTGAVVAGASAVAAYLDAKFHIRKDLAALREQRQVTKLVEKRTKETKLSYWYFFEEQANRLQDEPCIWHRPNPSDQATTYTWTETYQNCCRYAQFLLANGIKPGELVATYVQNSPEFMFNMMGSWAIGCAPALINFNLAGDALIHCLKVANSRVLIVDEDSDCQRRIEDCRSRIEELGMRILILGADLKAKIGSLSPDRPDNSLRDGVAPEFPIFLFYTSGTTGFSKACPMQTQRAYGLGDNLVASTGIKPGPGAGTWYVCMPLYHGTGCVVAVGCMKVGTTLAIGKRFSVRNFWHDIHDSKANGFVYVGETARYLLAAPPSPLDKDHELKAIFGNGLRPDIWARFQERFNIPIVHEFFNSTEGMFGLGNVCKGPFHTAHVGHQGLIRRRMTRNLYVPVAIDHDNGDQIWRDPKTGFARRKSYQEGGEIIVACQSQNDFSGYWKNQEATDKRFERDVFRKGDLFYRTGDALRRDAEGRWYFLDRLGDTFRWKSENVSTAEVAEVLGRFPDLVEANVYGVALPGHDGRAGCAAVFIEPERRKSFDYQGLLAHARRSLPRYAVPVFIRLVHTPAPMHNNKQNKGPLRKEGVNPEEIVKGVAGRDDDLLWLEPGANTYRPFTQRDWQTIVNGKVRL